MLKNNRLSQLPSSGDLFDELLVTQLRQGDRAAAQRLYKRWSPRLLRAARRYCGSDDGAGDLAQECWLAIWKGLARLKDPSKFRAYIFGVLHRRGADYIRKKIRERNHLIAQEDAGLQPIDVQAPRQEEKAAIHQAFAALPPDQRLAAHLHFVEGLSLTEIATAQSIPTGTAKSRLFHARRKLKEALGENSKGEEHD